MTSICASPAQATPTALNGSTNCIPPVTTDDLEEVMMELNNFDRQHIKDLKTKSPAIPPLLEGYLQFIAKRHGSAQTNCHKYNGTVSIHKYVNLTNSKIIMQSI